MCTDYYRKYNVHCVCVAGLHEIKGVMLKNQLVFSDSITKAEFLYVR